MNWPKTKDGELLRRLHRDGINLFAPQKLEFNVDFNYWPPSAEVLTLLKSKYRDIKLYEPGEYDESQEGYVSVRTRSVVSHEYVTRTQHEITEVVGAYGGYCNSWALLPRHSEE